MAHIKKFLFETDFDQPAAKAKGGEAAKQKAPKPPPPPTYGEQDLARARQEGYEAGVAAARREAEESDARRLAKASERMAQGLAAVQQRQEQANAEIMRQAVMVAMAVAAKMLPELQRRHGLGEIEAVLRDCLERLTPETRVLVRVHPDLVEAVRGLAEEITSRAAFVAHLEVMADEAVAVGDCRIDWDSGGAERKAELLWREIEGIVERYLGGEAAVPTPEAGAPVPDEPKEA